MARPTYERNPLAVTYWTTKGDGTIVTAPVQTTTDSSGRLMSHVERSYGGSVTPGYKSKKQRERKKLAPLAHVVTYRKDSGTKYAYNDWDYPAYRPQFSTVQYASNAVYFSGLPAFAHLVDAYNVARSRAAADVNKMKMNLAQAFGERKQTANLLASTMVRITALARSIKNVDPQAFIHAAGISSKNGVTRVQKQMKQLEKEHADRRLSNHWLEFQYGWKPLLQDCWGAVDLLAKHVQLDRYNSSDVKGSAKIHRFSTSGTGEWNSPIVTLTTETRCKMGIRYRMDSADRAILAQTGIDNPALLAWELLPYSFVIDWFVPVGNYLQSLNDFAGFTFLDGWVSNRTEQWYTVEYTGKVTFESTRVKWRNGFSKRYQAEYKRDVLSSFPGANTPSFKNPIGGEPLARFFSAYALARVLFRK